MPSAMEGWLEEATPERREVQVCFDRGLLSQVKAAEARLDATVADRGSMLGATEEETELKEHLDELKDAVRSKTRTLVFEGLGWGRWRELIAAHPPTEDQDDVFKRAVKLGFMPHAVVNIGYNAETFVPAAIVASCTEPGISLHEAETMLRKAPPGVLERVWTAVLEVNTAGGDDPFVSPNGASVGALASAKK